MKRLNIVLGGWRFEGLGLRLNIVASAPAGFWMMSRAPHRRNMFSFFCHGPDEQLIKRTIVSFTGFQFPVWKRRIVGVQHIVLNRRTLIRFPGQGLAEFEDMPLK